MKELFDSRCTFSCLPVVHVHIMNLGQSVTGLLTVTFKVGCSDYCLPTGNGDWDSFQVIRAIT